MVTTTTVYRLIVLGLVMLTGCKPKPQPQPGPTPAPAPVATCESLDALPLGATAVVGVPPVNSFQPPTMDIGARPFQLFNGNTATNGSARIENGGHAGGTGNEIKVNNIVMAVSLGPGQILKTIRFNFGEYGGNLNVSVNDNLANFSNFADINGKTIGGVTAKVLSGGLGNDKGMIEFAGNMNYQASGLGQFAVGGQELYIDNICFTK